MVMSEVFKELVQRSMTMSELPKDLVEEILCRVPATSLKRLRNRCKAWNHLYNDKRFTRKHSDKAPKQFLALTLKDYRVCPMSVNLHGTIPYVVVKNELSLVNPHSNKPAQVHIERVTHCDGLLLCIPDGKSIILVWNPLTCQTRWLDPGNRYTTRCSFVLGYYQDNKSFTESYKILSFSGCNKISEIFDFYSDSWRMLDDVVPDCAAGYTDHIVSLKGYAYWFAEDKTNTHIGLSLLRFDFSIEKSSGLVPLPYQYHSYCIATLSVFREEKLSVLLRHKRTSKTEVWVTNKFGESKHVSWSKVLALDLSPGVQISRLGSFLLDQEKKVIVCYERCMNIETWKNSIHMIYIVGEDNKVTQVKLVTKIYGCCPIIMTQSENPRKSKR